MGTHANAFAACQRIAATANRGTFIWEKHLPDSISKNGYAAVCAHTVASPASKLADVAVVNDNACRALGRQMLKRT